MVSFSEESVPVTLQSVIVTLFRKIGAKPPGSIDNETRVTKFHCQTAKVKTS